MRENDGGIDDPEHQCADDIGYSSVADQTIGKSLSHCFVFDDD